MSDTAISPGVGAIEATGNLPGNVQSAVMQPTTGAMAAVGLAPPLGFAVLPGIGSIVAQGRQPSGGMWAETATGTTTWTVLP